MITEAILNVFFVFTEFLLGLIPNFIFVGINAISGFIELISYGSIFIDVSVFAYCVITWFSWYVISLSWAIIEWLYKKIPGVN